MNIESASAPGLAHVGHYARAYFDECTDDATVFLMAGWLGGSEEWEKFSECWSNELSNKPSIRYFNHNEARGLKDEFLHWSEKDRDAKLMSLAGVIARHKLTGFIGGVSVSRFKSFFAGSVLPQKTLRSILKFTEPYHFCCQCVIAQTLGHQAEEEKNLEDQVDFIFDEGVPFLDDCISNYQGLKNVLPQKVHRIAGTVMSGNDKKVVALQAADMLAGQALLNLRTKVKPEPLDVMRAKRIFTFHCLPQNPESIPRAIQLTNIVWSTKQLDKVRRGRSGTTDKKE
jgi:hypothetical protein